MLCSCGFGDVWYQQGVANPVLFINHFKQRLIDMSRQTWHDDLLENKKLYLYQGYKDSLVFEKYFTFNLYFKHRIALTKFRCSNHKLAIEHYRHTNVARIERFCKFCKNKQNVEVIEDEVHFLLICPLYQNFRQLFLDKYINCMYNVNENFKNIMSSHKLQCIKDLSAYLYNALNVHSAQRTYQT